MDNPYTNPVQSKEIEAEVVAIPVEVKEVVDPKVEALVKIIEEEAVISPIVVSVPADEACTKNENGQSVLPGPSIKPSWIA